MVTTTGNTGCHSASKPRKLASAMEIMFQHSMVHSGLISGQPVNKPEKSREEHDSETKLNPTRVSGGFHNTIGSSLAKSTIIPTRL